ncbi:MAG TPA: hypothetical protein VN841_28620 [Bryobacteraceae bacterium]|nr:hypothetical protein [Bryobacteraceae bacterium]
MSNRSASNRPASICHPPSRDCKGAVLKSRLIPVVAALLCALAPLHAVETKTWEQSSMADFDKGAIKRLSLSSDGRLTLAPAVKELTDPSVTFLWAVARDSKGNVYAGGGGLGGGKAKLTVIDTQGRSKTLAELDGLAVQALAVDRQDRVYAATSPDGKVYRVDASGKADIFYDPKTKYIWALVFAPNGDLFVATGDGGEIHRVTPAGAGSVFFRSGETHVRSLAIDTAGNLIAGTDPGGLVLHVTRAAGGNQGEGFVLYQSPKREITTVAVSAGGDIYAAATGTRPAVAPAPAPPPVPGAQQQQPGAAAGAVQITTVRPAQPAPLTIAPAPPVTGGSELYRIQADGYPRKIWSHAQDLIYALAFDAQGRVLAGTGNHGALYRIDNDHLYTRLLNLEPTQITGLTAAPGGTLYAVTGNIGKVFAIGPGVEASGTYESDVLDAAAFSYWGRIAHEPEGDSGLTIETRSGNLNRTENNWSPWAKLSAGRIASPAARFLQYRLTLSGTAQLSDVSVAYQMKNVAPVIEELEITPANYRFPAPPANAAATNPPLTLPPLGRKPTPNAASESQNTPALNWAKGFLGARWLAADENGDTLLFTVEIRGKNETSWKLIRDKVKERYVSWDSSAFPDGEYVVRVTASDAPSNPPGEALTASRETDPFLIDNTPPEITGLAATPAGAKLQVRFHVKDALTVLGKAELSVNGGDWMVVEPTTRLTDSTEHDYRVEIDKPAGEVTIAVRAEDSYENQAVAKIVVR